MSLVGLSERVAGPCVRFLDAEDPHHYHVITFFSESVSYSAMCDIVDSMVRWEWSSGRGSLIHSHKML